VYDWTQVYYWKGKQLENLARERVRARIKAELAEARCVKAESASAESTGAETADRKEAETAETS
jgi:hypothetical protein